MPIYEYVCEDCGTRYERIVLNKAQEIACPKCESRRSTLQLSVFHAPNGSANASSKSAAAESTPSSFSGSGGGCCGGSCGRN